MKYAITLLMLLCAAALHAQTGQEDSKVFTTVEQMPEYPGGEKALLDYLMKVQYPREAKEKNIEGKVFVKFVIEKDGTVSSVEIEKGSNHLLDTASTEHVKQMPAWKPGRQSGEPVRVQYVVPFSFVLADAPQKQ